MAEKEYIERNDLINNRPPQRNPDQIGKEEYNQGYNDGIKVFLSCIKIQPAADVAPIRHGHWIQQDRIIASYECSECHCSIDQEPHYNYSDNIMIFPKYCEHCGAKMDDNEEV